MDSNKILSAEILDIIFEGRNKEYGAYDLRKTYNKRLKKALLTSVAFCGLLFGGYILANNLSAKNNKLMEVDDFSLIDLKPDETKNEPPPPPPPVKPPEQPRIEMKSFTPPRIVNEDVNEDEKPPEMKDLTDVKIGNINVDGIKDDNIVAPPITDDGRGIVEAPRKNKEPEDTIFITVQIQSEYPGGPPAWQRYLNKNFRYPQEAMDNGIQGKVMVQFIVDREGNVSNVEAVSGPNELKEEAVRVIKKSGKWNPAIQNGRQVKSYKNQLVVFQLENE